MHQVIRWLIVIVVATALSSCGFQLRDNYQLPPAMQSVVIKAPAFSEFAKVVEQRFEMAGATLDAPQSDDLVSEILNEKLDRRTLTITESGQVCNYEMNY